MTWPGHLRPFGPSVDVRADAPSRAPPEASPSSCRRLGTRAGPRGRGWSWGRGRVRRPLPRFAPGDAAGQPTRPSSPSAAPWMGASAHGGLDGAGFAPPPTRPSTRPRGGSRAVVAAGRGSTCRGALADLTSPTTRSELRECRSGWSATILPRAPVPASRTPPLPTRRRRQTPSGCAGAGVRPEAPAGRAGSLVRATAGRRCGGRHEAPRSRLPSGAGPAGARRGLGPPRSRPPRTPGSRASRAGDRCAKCGRARRDSTPPRRPTDWRRHPAWPQAAHLVRKTPAVTLALAPPPGGPPASWPVRRRGAIRYLR